MPKNAATKQRKELLIGSAATLALELPYDFMEKQSLTSENMDEVQPNLKWFTRGFVGAQVFGILAIVFVTVWMGSYREGFSWSSEPIKEFNYHPVLMVVGMIVLYANAIMVYRVFRNERKKKIKLLHASLHALAFVLALIALVAVFDFHNYSTPPKPNLYSLHSWLGISTVVLFSLQFVAGFVSFLYPGLRLHLRASFLPFHTFFGVGIFILAIMSALTGILEKAIFTLGGDYAQLVSEGVLANCLGITLVVFGLLVVSVVVNANYKRRPLPEEEMPLVASHEQ